MTAKKEHVPRCGANTRANLPCRIPAGTRTNHKGTGKCWKHGGASEGPPEGNKNALTTGEYETLHASALPAPQRALYDALDTAARSQTEGAIRLISIREHRILLRIAHAEVLEAESETGFELHSVSEESGFGRQGKISVSTKEHTPLIAHVMALEDVLTRVQTLKARYIDQLRGILKENPPQTGGLDAIVSIINASAKAIVEAEQESTAT